MPIPLKTAAAAAAMSPSKARMYLISLIQTGLVSQNTQTGLYSLGPYALQLGTRALQRMSSMDVVREEMRALQRKTQALVLLCNWQETGVIIVAAEEGGEPQPMQWRIGGTASVTSTATGAVFLAFGPQKAVWRHAVAELRNDGFSPTGMKRRMRELEERAADIRDKNVAVADPVVFAKGVTISGFAAISAPIFDESKQLRYVLTLLYHSDRPHRNKADLLKQTMQAADQSSVHSKMES